MLLNIILIIIGFVMLVVGANLLVKGSSNIALRFHIPEILIGLTIVAIGTSAPELIVSITSSINGNNNLIIGNAIGSNFCNLLLILGLMAIIHPVKVEYEVKKFHLPIAIATVIIVLLCILNFFNQTPLTINRLEGFILVILFLAYLVYPIYLEINDIIIAYKESKVEHKRDEKSNRQKQNIFISVLFLVFGMVLLKYGSDFVVDYSIKIAKIFNLSESVIGSTIVAIGTASPELFTSIIAIIKKDTDLAIGNLVGSCILNLLLILGVSAIINPLIFSINFFYDLLLLGFATFLIWLFNFIGTKNTITRIKGIILLCLFGFYMYTLFIYTSWIKLILLC